MKQERIYLDGKIKGMPNKNKETFDRIEAKLLKEGYQVFNAQRYLEKYEHISYDEAKTMCLLESQKCDTIALIRGWEASERVREYMITWLNNKNQKKHVFADTLTEIPKFKKVELIYKY